MHSEARAGCLGLCPIDFEILPEMETPHPPQALCPSASLPHCENSKSFMQVHSQINSILVTQAPEVLSIRHGLSLLFLLSPTLSPELLKQFLSGLHFEIALSFVSYSSWLSPHTESPSH